MQKMQQAAGGKGRGLNGMPTPAQIQALQRAMPPGMLQQMQRQLRNGGGMQEMMKAMMQGQGGDQLDVEEMQRTSINMELATGFRSHIIDRYDGPNGRRSRRPWWSRRTRWIRWHARYGRYVQNDGNGRRAMRKIYAVRVSYSEFNVELVMNWCTCKIPCNDMTLVWIEPYQRLVCCFHRFLMLEAADWLPNMKAEVCLSAPVVFDTKEEFANAIYMVM